MSRILEGYRVVDLTRYIAGPFCSMLLADMGAEVIKVEKPGSGEVSRELSPWKDGVSLFFPAYNRNKKSVSLDTKRPEGLQILKELIKNSDILIENYRVGTMEKMGLSYEEVKKINPKIIMVSVTGFGQVGPLKDTLAFDGVISAMAAITRVENGRAERSHGALHDHMAAMYATIATLLAVIDREKTGKGQYIDVAMFASSALIRNDFLPEAYFNNGKIGDEEAPYGFLYLNDGCVYFHAGLGDMYNRLLSIVDDPFLHEERFSDVQVRIEHSEELIAHIQEWAKDKTKAEVNGLFTGAGVTSAIVADTYDLSQNQHLWEAGYLHMMPVHGIDGGVPYIGLPFKLSEHRDIIYQAPPDVGENNDDIYRGVLGYDSSQIDELHDKGVI